MKIKRTERGSIFLILFGLVFVVAGVQSVLFAFIPTTISCTAKTGTRTCTVSRIKFPFKMSYETVKNPTRVDIASRRNSKGSRTYYMQLISLSQKIPLEAANNMGQNARENAKRNINQKLSGNQSFVIKYKQLAALPFGMVFIIAGAIVMFCGIPLRRLPQRKKGSITVDEESGIMEIMPFFSSPKYKDIRGLADLEYVKVEYINQDVFNNYAEYMQGIAIMNKKGIPLKLRAKIDSRRYDKNIRFLVIGFRDKSIAYIPADSNEEINDMMFKIKEFLPKR